MARVDEYASIQNALIDKGRNGTFYAVTYDSNHRLTRGAQISPVTVLANEISASFGESHTRRRQVDDYTSWTWQLHLKFNGQAILHEFHYTLCENFVLVPSNVATGVRQATARLVAAPQILHPTTKEPSSGTSVIYTLNVALRPL
jgi:hypothetical protein